MPGSSPGQRSPAGAAAGAAVAVTPCRPGSTAAYWNRLPISMEVTPWRRRPRRPAVALADRDVGGGRALAAGGRFAGEAEQQRTRAWRGLFDRDQQTLGLQVQVLRSRAVRNLDARLMGGPLGQFRPVEGRGVRIVRVRPRRRTRTCPRAGRGRRRRSAAAAGLRIGDRSAWPARRSAATSARRRRTPTGRRPGCTSPPRDVLPDRRVLVGGVPGDPVPVAPSVPPGSSRRRSARR